MNSFTAIADPTRRRIVELLAARSLSSGDIAARFEMTPSAISQHLKILREAKLVRKSVVAQRRIYELERGGFDEVEGWLRKVRSFWATRLDALEMALEEEGEHESNG